MTIGSHFSNTLLIMLGVFFIGKLPVDFAGKVVFTTDCKIIILSVLLTLTDIFYALLTKLGVILGFTNKPQCKEIIPVLLTYKI